MVHLFFETIANQPGLANSCAKQASHNPNPIQSFTQVFSIFFPEDGELDSDVESWLEAVADRFEFNKKNENRFTIWEVEKLFRRFGYHPKDPDNSKVFNFWLYLVWMYKKLLDLDYDRDDNLFQFMEGCSIYNVKMLIMGNAPTKDNPSSGYAFHGSVCPSTKKIVDFVDFELDEVGKYLQDHRLVPLSNWEINGAKSSCNLWGWIRQGVLLLNSKLTFEGNEDLRQGWEIFTDFVVEYLSEEVGNVVFLFLGNAVADKSELVNESRNFVMKLYHPAHYTYVPERNVKWNMDWKTMLPFINANFYRWQSSGREMEYMVDWTSVGKVKKRKARRLKQWNQLFEDVRAECNFIARGSQVTWRDYIVKRSVHGYLSLEINLNEDEDEEDSDSDDSDYYYY